MSLITKNQLQTSLQAVKKLISLKADKNDLEGMQKKIDKVSLDVVGKKGSGMGSVVFNKYNSNIASGEYSFSSGEESSATGQSSFAANGSLAEGYYSHAVNQSQANGLYAHSEGEDAQANGQGSHAEGYLTKANGSYSHSEGFRTQTNEDAAHAEGEYTVAAGEASHAEGSGTIAHYYQHAQGKFNIEDTENKYAHIVGNGQSDEERSNAHTIDWSGNAWYQGDIYIGSTSGTNRDEGSKKLITEDSVISKIADVEAALYNAIVENDIEDKAYVDEKIAAIPQSDWNQNNENSNDYIKNRTHWLEKDAIVIPETTISREPMVWNWDLILLEPEKTYKVMWDGVLYERELAIDDVALRVLGNASLYNGNYISEEQKIDTGEPFCIVTTTYMGLFFTSEIYAREKATTHTVGIEGILEEVTMSFSSKYGDNTSFFPFVTGNIYNVSWDGIQYSLECIDNGGQYLGNGSLLDASLENTGEPFAITSYGGIYTTEGEHTFAIEGLVPERTYNFFPLGSEAEGMYIQFETDFNFVPLNKYKIIFDNIEYELEYKRSNGLGNFCFGNEYMDYFCLPGINPNTPPFYFSPEYSYIITYPGTHTIEIREDKYHTINKNYLPNLVGA